MSAADRLVLTRSPALRMLTLLLFYFTQGFPIGLFFYAVPSWMAASGAGTGAVAAVVGAAGLPWTLKLVNGFLIDRYTFLPMGRRRIWIIGAQGMIVLVLLAGAAISPAHSDVFMLSAIGFAANAAVTFQDVGIDSLAVDIMAESERAKAGGIMFGAQLLGISGATALGGAMLETYGFAACMATASLIPLTVMFYGMLIREREGERRLPWSAGESHPHNLAIHSAAWVPLLKNGFRAVFAPLSLALLPLLLLRALPAGAHEAFHPILTTGIAGWSLSDYTNVMSTSQLVAGLLGLTLGGWAIDAIGAQRSTIVLMSAAVLMFIAMGLAQDYWANDAVLLGYFFGVDILGVFLSIAIIPIAMRMCSPAVAATQFTIYMAVSNFGRPLGASLAAATAGLGAGGGASGGAGAGNPAMMYWSLGAVLGGAGRAAAGCALSRREPRVPRDCGGSATGRGACPGARLIAGTLPPQIGAWFAQRGWQVRRHQLEMLAADAALLVADTGAGKTLAGFLPTLAAFAGPDLPPDGLHTHYVLPLKALAHDVQRNLMAPVGQIYLPIRVETRSGDTPSERKVRQRAMSIMSGWIESAHWRCRRCR